MSEIKDFVPLTSLLIAAERAIETERPNRLFEDPFARMLAGSEAFALLQPEQNIVTMATNLRRDTLSEKEESWGWDLVRGSVPRTKAINSTISPVFFRSLFPLQKRPLTNCQSES